MFTLGMYGAELMAVTVSGGMGLVPVGGTVMTLRQFIRAFQLVAGAVTSQNLLFQVEEVTMFCTSGKEMGAPTGNWLHDSAREITEMASMQFAVYGLMNPRTYQRPKITPLPDETGLTVPGGTGVAVVPNGTAPAVKPPYLPGQYPEYPAAVQGWAQQALPGGGRGVKVGKVKPSLPKGAKPLGNYADSSKRTYQRQNEAADLLANNGYKVEMLDEIPGGNGYGLKETANPDFLIENKVFDCYSPGAETKTQTIINEIRSKTKDQAPNIVLNLEDYEGSVDELIELIKRKATPEGDLKRLEELRIIKDGEIIDILG